MNWRLPFLLFFCCALCVRLLPRRRTPEKPAGQDRRRCRGAGFQAQGPQRPGGESRQFPGSSRPASFRHDVVSLLPGGDSRGSRKSTGRDGKRIWKSSISSSMSRRPRSPPSPRSMRCPTGCSWTAMAGWPRATRSAESRRLSCWTGRGKSCATSAGTSTPCSKAFELQGPRSEVRGSRIGERKGK